MWPFRIKPIHSQISRKSTVNLDSGDDDYLLSPPALPTLTPSLTMHHVPFLWVVHQQLVPVRVQQATQLLLAQPSLSVRVQVFLFM